MNTEHYEEKYNHPEGYSECQVVSFLKILKMAANKLKVK